VQCSFVSSQRVCAVYLLGIDAAAPGPFHERAGSSSKSFQS